MDAWVLGLPERFPNNAYLILFVTINDHWFLSIISPWASMYVYAYPCIIDWYPCIAMDIHGHSWISMYINGPSCYPCMCMDDPWMCMDLYSWFIRGYEWKPMVAHAAPFGKRDALLSNIVPYFGCVRYYCFPGGVAAPSSWYGWKVCRGKTGSKRACPFIRSLCRKFREMAMAHYARGLEVNLVRTAWAPHA